MGTALTRPDLNGSSRRDSYSGSSLLKKNLMNKNSKVLALKYRPQIFEAYILMQVLLNLYSFIIPKETRPVKLSLRLLPLGPGRIHAANALASKTIIAVIISNLQEKIKIYFSLCLSASKTPRT